MLYRLFAVFICIFASINAYSAVDPFDFPSDQERLRYHDIVRELRCPKCKNSDLAGTNSQIAIDLRREIHKMVVEGQSNEQIIDFMVSRYGDFVLYRPRMEGKTLYVWFGPLILFGIGLLAVVVVVVRRRKVMPKEVSAALTSEEEQQLQAILSETKEPK